MDMLLNYANEESDDIIGGSTKAKSWPCGGVCYWRFNFNTEI